MTDDPIACPDPAMVDSTTDASTEPMQVLPAVATPSSIGPVGPPQSIEPFAATPAPDAAPASAPEVQLVPPPPPSRMPPGPPTTRP
ncbi:MAG TPA: hypothetical protein VGQ62_20450 [Chloroflexota bacterium]|nr:hypothetical protein [Chloroflexota bacterium]